MIKLLYASSKDSDLRYRIPGDIPDPFFCVDTGETAHVFLDSREYGVFAEHNHDRTVQLHRLEPVLERAKERQDLSGAAAAAVTVLEECKATGQPVGVSDSFPLRLYEELKKAGVQLEPQAELYPARLQKTEAEKEQLREALQRTYPAFELIEAILRESEVREGKIWHQGQWLTSEYLKNAVDKVLLEYDMLDVEGMIISSGAQAAIPHHRGAGPLLANATIICDIFPRHRASGYFSDMTRTYVKGTPSARVKEMYEAVAAAQAAAFSVLKAGVAAKDVHQACVDAFMERGFEVGLQGFVHGTGHGLGLDIHEGPYVRKNVETILQPGNVVTIEPGLYYEQDGGVRIEDVAYVTADGFENLTDYPKAYHIE